MSLYLFNDWLNEMERMRPSRLLDQHFGLGLTPEDLLTPMTVSPLPRSHLHRHYYRPWRVESKDSGSTVKYDTDKFLVNLDVQQFAPEEIKVKVVGNSVVIEGKHEEKQDEHGFISRQFVRKYNIPKEYKIEQVASTLSSDGVLTISAPRNEAIEGSEKVIPITHTGPHKAVKEGEKKESGDKKEAKK